MKTRLLVISRDEGKAPALFYLAGKGPGDKSPLVGVKQTMYDE